MALTVLVLLGVCKKAGIKSSLLNKTAMGTIELIKNNNNTISNSHASFFATKYIPKLVMVKYSTLAKG